MITTERDSRVDPRPGDVLTKPYYDTQKTEIRTVAHVNDSGIRWSRQLPKPYSSWASLESWKKWARNATVVKRAEESS